MNGLVLLERRVGHGQAAAEAEHVPRRQLVLVHRRLAGSTDGGEGLDLRGHLHGIGPGSRLVGADARSHHGHDLHLAAVGLEAALEHLGVGAHRVDDLGVGVEQAGDGGGDVARGWEVVDDLDGVGRDAGVGGAAVRSRGHGHAARRVDGGEGDPARGLVAVGPGVVARGALGLGRGVLDRDGRRRGDAHGRARPGGGLARGVATWWRRSPRPRTPPARARPGPSAWRDRPSARGGSARSRRDSFDIGGVGGGCGNGDPGARTGPGGVSGAEVSGDDLGVLEDLDRRSGDHDPPLIEGHESVGHGRHEAQVVLHDEEGGIEVVSQT